MSVLRDLLARPRWGDMCRCGHPRAWHDHYNASTRCASLPCPCARFRRKARAT
jgi:hypothetical protein